VRYEEMQKKTEFFCCRLDPGSTAFEKVLALDFLQVFLQALHVLHGE
jgi:hypothetical protein